jgi:hypothetical protein
MQVDDVKCVKQYNGGIHGSEQQVLHGFTVLRDLDCVNLRGGHLTLVMCKQEQWNGTLYVLTPTAKGAVYAKCGRGLFTFPCAVILQCHL